tara:strand:- start:744 stop:1034 length:291 start_codon:yes stop_codon:yes gene_type:complete
LAINNSLNILTSEEIDELYEIPKIDAEDRELLFEITVEDEVYLEQQKSIYNKINYILQSGYFRASRQFYNFAFSDVRDDTWFIINRYFPHTHFPKS